MGTGACFHSVTLTEYFGTEAAARYTKLKAETDSRPRPSNNIAWFDPRKIKHEVKTFNNVKVVYSKDFPLSVQELLPIAEVMSRTQRHWSNLERFLQTKVPAGASRYPSAT